MNTEQEYIEQLEYENSKLKDTIEALHKKCEWEEKTKDLRTLASEYHKMHDEIYKVNIDNIVNHFLSIDANSIIDMWSNGYRIFTEVRDVDDIGIFFKKRYSVHIVGPYTRGHISFHRDKFFGICLAVRRSKFYPFVSDSCFLTMEHNRVCDFSGAIAESCHIIDSKRSKDIINLIEKVNICKGIMNGKLTSMDCYVKRDTFKFPWTDIDGFKD